MTQHEAGFASYLSQQLVFSIVSSSSLHEEATSFWDTVSALYFQIKSESVDGEQDGIMFNLLKGIKQENTLAPIIVS